MHLPAPLVHAKYLHGVPSESIPAAVSVLSLSAPCGAVVCPSELPLTRQGSAFADCFPPREHLCIDLGSSPPSKGPFFAHFFGALQMSPGTPRTPLLRG